jgi:Cu-Zn family superoxide dismutase
MKASAIIISLISSLSVVAGDRGDPITIKAVAVLKGAKAGGNVTLEQTFGEHGPSQTKITYSLTGSDANALRGFHIHASGDLRDGCASAGAHYNPFNQDHGAPTDRVRHVGDLGNVQTDANGNSQGTITDRMVQLGGKYSVIGRAFVLHAGTDDLGKTASTDSKKTGNAGGRAACGVIGLA